MKFILENYIIFVLIGLFIIFALIGYIIDTFRKSNNTNENNNMNIPQQINGNENIISQQIQKEDLLNEYNNSNK